MNRIQTALGSTAVRFSLLFLGLFFAASVGLVFYVTSLSTKMIEGQAKSAIDQQLDSLEQAFERAGIPGLIRFVEREARQPGAHLYLIADQSGRILSGNVMDIEAGVLDRSGWVEKSFVYSRFGEGENSRFKAIAQVLRLPNGLTLLVGRDLSEPERFRAIVRQALTLALGFMTIGALLIWVFVGRGALKRIDGVTLESGRIIAGDLSRRLPVGGSGDEFDRLALSLNSLLNRIELLDKGVRDVSNNVAHDLKTPLTRLQARTENALSSAKNTNELRAALQSNLDDTEALIKTFNAILTISKLEAGSILPNRQLQSINLIVADVVELLEPIAEEKGVVLSVQESPKFELMLHRELIAQAVVNLIENALNHAGPGNKNVNVVITGAGDSQIGLIISDNGVGIPEALRKTAAERFVRLDASRSNPGTGLGLSLVKAIAEAHGGSLHLEDNTPGLKAVVLLPRD